jgi:hemolysin III
MVTWLEYLLPIVSGFPWIAAGAGCAMNLQQAEAVARRTIHRIEDEIANAITHGVGLLLSLVGAVVLLVFAVSGGSSWQIVGYSIYGATLVILYAASTAYHCVQHPRAKEILRVVDHACIFLLIAGTYTPFTLTALRGAWGWLLLLLIWMSALAGITCKLVSARRGLSESALPYVATGWLALVAVKPIVQAIPLSGLLWLLAGGVSYTAGTIFYKLDGRRFFHAIWHVFVLAGSIFHYCAVVFHAI